MRITFMLLVVVGLGCDGGGMARGGKSKRRM